MPFIHRNFSVSERLESINRAVLYRVDDWEGFRIELWGPWGISNPATDHLDLIALEEGEVYLEYRLGVVHQGKNVRLFREWRDYNQQALARALGKYWDQKRISRLEGEKILPVPILFLIAQFLKVPIGAITLYSREELLDRLCTMVQTTS